MRAEPTPSIRMQGTPSIRPSGHPTRSSPNVCLPSYCLSPSRALSHRAMPAPMTSPMIGSVYPCSAARGALPAQWAPVVYNMLCYHLNARSRHTHSRAWLGPLHLAYLPCPPPARPAGWLSARSPSSCPPLPSEAMDGGTEFPRAVHEQNHGIASPAAGSPALILPEGASP